MIWWRSMPCAPRSSMLAPGLLGPRPGPPAVTLTSGGQTTLPELIAAIATADIFIGPDTGPMHMAV
jgi:hypothetical protein